MSTRDRDLNRRHFLSVVAGSTVIAACSSGKDGSPEPFGDVSAGNVKDVPVGTLSAVGSEPCVLGRDADGLYAMTITCTHEGCDLDALGNGDTAMLHCSCHGSEFDRNGKRTRGPADSNLTHFAVEVDAMGEITVRGGSKVSSTTRTPVA